MGDPTTAPQLAAAFVGAITGESGLNSVCKAVQETIVIDGAVTPTANVLSNIF